MDVGGSVEGLCSVDGQTRLACIPRKGRCLPQSAATTMAGSVLA